MLATALITGLGARRDICSYRHGADAAIRHRAHHEPRLWRDRHRRRLRRLVLLTTPSASIRCSACAHRAAAASCSTGSSTGLMLHPLVRARQGTRQARGQLDPGDLRPALRHPGRDAGAFGGQLHQLQLPDRSGVNVLGANIAANRLLALRACASSSAAALSAAHPHALRHRDPRRRRRSRSSAPSSPSTSPGVPRFAFALGGALAAAGGVWSRCS